MPELRRTVPQGEHYHIVYLRDDGSGIASPYNGHTPIVQFQSGIDPMSAEEVQEPAWIIVDPDRTLHELEDIPVSEKVEERDKQQVLADFVRDYKECFDYERKSRTMGMDSERMYCHEQWKAEDRPTDPNRAVVTINVLEDKIDNLVGYQRQNRTDIVYLPSEKGDAFGADVANIVVKKYLNMCYYQREKSKVFEDEGVVGRGLFNIGEDYERNVQGVPFVERFPWNEVYFGPHEKEDLSDCEVMFKAKWFTEEKLKALFPDAFKGEGEEPKETVISSDPVINEDGGIDTAKYELIDKNKKKFRLLERWKKTYDRFDVYVFPEDAYALRPEGWDKTDINSLAAIPGFYKVNRESYRMRQTFGIVSTLFEDKYISDKDFCIVPVYAKFRHGIFWGKIESVKDLQMLLNKAYAQFTELISQIRNGVVYYDDDTFGGDLRLENDFKQHGTTPGHVQKVANIERRPVRDEGIKFPSEIVEAIQLFGQTIREIMNINLSLQGMSQENQSGVAMRQRIIQQLIGNDFLFDNMSFAEQLVAKLFLKKIQKTHTPERLLRILGNEDEKAKMQNPQNPGVMLNGRPMSEYPEEDLKKFLKNIDFTDYDVDIAEAPNAPSAMMGAFLMCLEAARAGAPIPPDIFINLYPLPEKLKRQILQSLQAAQQAQAEAEDKKYATEIEKTKIAHAEGGLQSTTPAQQAGIGSRGILPI